MIKSVKLVWYKIRPPHRITRYGSVCLAMLDERTALEKVCDYVDSLLDRIESAFTRRFKTRYVWHTFFDISTRSYISSMDDIKRIERDKGWVYASFNDISTEAKSNDKNNIDSQKKMVKRDISKIYHDVKKGRKFTSEMREKYKQGKYEINPNARAWNNG